MSQSEARGTPATGEEAPVRIATGREHLLHALYEAAELEHNLMCTYLYAAFSLRQGEEEGLSAREAEAVARWRRTIIQVAVEEMGHLTAVCNITAALGGAPHFARDNFPLDPGSLPAGVVVKLAPFGEPVLQHFIHLERPRDSHEEDGTGFTPELRYLRVSARPRLTPMALDYETVGDFYLELEGQLTEFVARVGEDVAFAGDPALQLSPSEVKLAGASPVRCLATTLRALRTIVEQGEGARAHAESSHYQRFLAIREEYAQLRADNPAFTPAFPAATNPVLRRPPRAEGRIWIDDEEAVRVVDLANTGYALMLRLLSYAYVLPGPSPEKARAVDLGIALMRSVTLLGEHAARLPAGPSHPGCNAGMSFTALRDAAPLLVGASAQAFFAERMSEMAEAARALARSGAYRLQLASSQLDALAARAQKGLVPTARTMSPAVVPAAPTANVPAPATTVVDGIEHVEGRALTVVYEGKKCIHARFCVTGAPTVFLANVKGPWIHPDTMDPEELVAIAHACPSGAIRYRRKDGRPDESAPPVNLLAIREAGPYAVRGALRLDDEEIGYRATLCRCGASKRKPFCDGSHHDVSFSASGEPASGTTDMLATRDGPLAVYPETNGPLEVRGNLEITSGTGRVVARVTQARLCRCGASGTKPFCDGSHARVGFRST